MVDETIRQPSNTNAGECFRNKGAATVGFEPSLRLDAHHPVAVAELPGFGSLHQRLMRRKLMGRLRLTMGGDIVRAGNKPAMERADPPGDQVGALEISDPDRAIEALGNQIDEAIAIRCVDLQVRMALCQRGQQGGAFMMRRWGFPFTLLLRHCRC